MENISFNQINEMLKTANIAQLRVVASILFLSTKNLDRIDLLHSIYHELDNIYNLDDADKAFSVNFDIFSFLNKDRTSINEKIDRVVMLLAWNSKRWLTSKISDVQYYRNMARLDNYYSYLLGYQGLKNQRFV